MVTSLPSPHRGRALHWLPAIALWITPPAQALGPALQARLSPDASPAASGLGFVRNEGQWPCEVLYHGAWGPQALTFTTEGLFLRLDGSEESEIPPVLRIVFGDVEEAAIEPSLPRSTPYHFLLGNRVASDVAAFDQLILRDVAPGIDVRLRSESAGFYYDIELAPGAHLEDLSILFEGAETVEALDDGSVLLSVRGHPITQVLGPSWQSDGMRTPFEVYARIEALGALEHALTFSAPERDHEQAAVVDPSLGFCTYVGSSVSESGIAFGAVDQEGATYLFSQNTSMTPTTPGSFQTSTGSLIDLWVAKVSPIGDRLEWATFIGGDATDAAFTIAVSEIGSVLLAGWTIASDFPTTPGAQEESSGVPPINGYGYAAELSPDGSSLLWSTLWAERVFTQPWGCAFGTNNEALVIYDYCDTCEMGFHPPGTPGAYDETFDLENSQLVSFDRTAGTLKWATYLPLRPQGLVVAVAPDGDVVVVGSASLQATDPFIATPGAFQTDRDGSFPAGVMRLSPDGSELRWATMLGDACCLINTNALALAVGKDDTVVVGGNAGTAATFPVTPNAFPGNPSNDERLGFVTKFSADGSSLVWSAVLGGTGASQSVNRVSIDEAGQVWAAGTTIWPEWPTTPDAFQPVFNGPALSADATLTKYGPFGETLDYSTYFGAPSSGERSIGLGLDPLGRPRLALTNDVAQLPTQPWVYEPNKPGGLDYAVAGFDVPSRPWRVLGGGSMTIGSAPNLAGGGDFQSGADVRLSVRAAKPFTPVWLVAGLAQVDLPILGGLLIPNPASLLPATTDDRGAQDWILPWPSPPLTKDVWFQAWCFDAAMPDLFSWTNGMRALVNGG